MVIFETVFVQWLLCLYSGLISEVLTVVEAQGTNLLPGSCYQSSIL